MASVLFFVAPVHAHADDSSSDDGYASQVLKVVRDIATNEGDGYGINTKPIAGNMWSGLAAGNASLGIFNQNSKTTTYSNLYDAATTKSNVVTAQGDAATYGAALDDLGLDHSIASGVGSDMFGIIGRFIFGLLAFLGYGLDLLTSSVFNLIGKLASYLNIFAWISTDPKTDTTIMAPIHAQLHSVYTSVKSISIIIITGMMAMGVGLAMLGRKVSQRGNEVGHGAGLRHSVYRYFVRLGMIIVIPIAAASIFTGLINEVDNIYSSKSDTSSEYAIYSNLFDFASWVQHSRLNLPASVNGKIRAGVEDGGAVSQVPLSHTDILRLNADGAGSAYANSALADYGSDTEKVKEKMESVSAKVKKDKSVSNPDALGLISKWFFSSKYNASDYSSFIVSRMPDKYVYSGGKGLGSSSTFKKTLEGANGFGGDNNDTFATNGTIYGVKKKGGRYFQTDSPATLSDAINSTSNKDGIAKPGGLSALGMYNYLTSIFTQTSFNWIDTSALSTVFTSPEHASVGLVGHGLVAMGNLMNMLSLLFAIAIINAVFAMFTFIAIINTVPKLGTYSFMAGSLSYGIKLISGILVFAVEILGGALLAKIFKMITISVSQAADGLLNSNVVTYTSVISKHTNVALGGAIGSSAYGLMNIAFSIMTLVLVFKLIKWRGPILQAVGKMIENASNMVLASFEGTAAMPSNHMGNGNMSTVGADGKNSAGGGIFDNKNGKDGEDANNGADGANGANGLGKNGANGAGGAHGGGGPAGPGHGKKKTGLIGGLTGARKDREAEMGRPMTGKEAMGFYALHGAGRAGSNLANAMAEGAGGFKPLSKVGGIYDAVQGRHADKVANQKQLDEEGMDESIQTGGDKAGTYNPETFMRDQSDIKDGNNLAEAVEQGATFGDEPPAQPAASAEEGNEAINDARSAVNAARFEAKRSGGTPAAKQKAQEKLRVAENKMANAKMSNLKRVSNQRNNTKNMLTKNAKPKTNREVHQDLSKLNRVNIARVKMIKQGNTATAQKLSTKAEQMTTKLAEKGYSKKFLSSAGDVSKTMNSINKSYVNATNGHAHE